MLCYHEGKVKKYHRHLMEEKLGRKLEKHELVDHIDGDRRNNSIENLRVCSHAENLRNQVRTKTTKGVYLQKSGKWRAKIHLNKKQIWLGYFNTKQEAIDAYNEASRRLHGEFGRPTG
jgi:hypothetical protein